MSERFGMRDAIFFGAVVCVLAIVFLGFYLRPKSAGGQVIVTVDGEEVGRFSLEQEQNVEIASTVDQTWELTDEEGNPLPKRQPGTVTNRFMIKDGQVSMIEADCPDKLCIHQKSISLEKETIVCLPNRVVLEVKSSKESSMDAVAQ